MIIMIKKIDLIAACSDLGVHVNGSNLGPEILLKNVYNDKKINKIKKINYPDNYKKELEKDNKKKNLEEVNAFNHKLYAEVQNTLKNNNFPITLRRGS